MVEANDRAIVAARDVCWGTLADVLVLFSLSQRRLHVLNESARDVWASTESPIREVDIIDRLARQFETEPHRIERDVRAAVDRLVEAGLCEVVRGPAAVTPTPEAERFPASCLPDPDNVAVLGPYQVLGIPVVMTVPDDVVRSDLSRIFDSLAIDRQDFWNKLYGEMRDNSAEIALAKAEELQLQHYGVIANNGGLSVSVNQRGLFTTPSQDMGRRMLIADLNSRPLSLLDDAVVLHASAVAVDGAMVVFPAVSGSGKSTLCAQLVERGHAYLTDEAVAIDVSTLQARPYHKSLCLEPGVGDLLGHLVDRLPGSGPWDVDPRTIGPGRLSSGGPVTAIVFPTYDPSLPEQLRPLESVDTLQLLLGNTFDFNKVGQAGFAALTRIASALPAYEMVHHGDGAHLARIEDLVCGFSSMASGM